MPNTDPKQKESPLRLRITENLVKQRLAMATRLCRKFGLDVLSFPDALPTIEALYRRGAFAALLKAFRLGNRFVGPYDEAHLLRRLAESGNCAVNPAEPAEPGRGLTPAESLDALLDRVARLLNRGKLVQAARTCRRYGVSPDSVPAINEAVEIALRRGKPQLVLGAFYEAGAFGPHTVMELLRLQARSGMPATFLQNAFRFGVQVGLEREIEAAIQWRRDHGFQDADAWQRKFEHLAALPAEPPEPPSIRPPTVLRLHPVRETSGDVKRPPSEVGTKDPSDPYIVSQVSRAKVERATAEHQAALKALERSLSGAGLALSNSNLIDLLGEGEGWTGIFEVKSITPDNERDQVRHAVSQLFEYRFLHELPAADLFVVFSAEPVSGWLVDYLRHLGVGVACIDDGSLAGPDALRARTKVRSAGATRSDSGSDGGTRL